MLKSPHYTHTQTVNTYSNTCGLQLEPTGYPLTQIVVCHIR